jgi:CRP/FNR family cyclic AMP-dependent transcriptional regulator
MMPNASNLFANFDEDALRRLAPNGIVRTFPKGAVLVNEGDDTDSMYLIIAGRVKTFLADEDGKEVVLNTMGVGEYFGELVLDGGPRSASVMALAACRIFVIPRGDIRQLIDSNPAFARDLIDKLIGRVRSLTDRVRDLTLKDVYGRFVRFVEQHAIERDGQRIVPERLTQQEMAARIGGSREMVSRIIKDLCAGGYISINAKHVTVHKKLPHKW